ncbi:MAG: adenylate/guanylate cyclase domain-containing protein [Reyranellaceae bacterium]
MDLLGNIRFGTERYPEKVARWLRTVNIGTRIAAAGHGFFAVVSFVYLAQFWWMAVAHTVAMLLFAGIPLLHRVGPRAGAIATIVLFYSEVIAFTWLIGTGAGIQLYFLLAVGLTVLYLGAEQVVVTTAVSAAMAIVLIVTLQLIVPDDTGLLPRSLIVTALITNAILSCGSLLLVVTYALGEVARAEAVAEREYQRSERLLANILPSAIAARLKSRPTDVIADRHDQASILFADLEGFTAQASDMEPEDLVQFLDRVFSDFDRLVEQHGLEKIKTTGDAYMVVSGVPTARFDHAHALADLALEMSKTATAWRDSRQRSVPIRMGISSGPVVAGIVGTRKFFYDVWGDAVNVAARMETTGSAGKIQVSQDVYECLRDDFLLEFRGEIEVKGKGSMPTWFLLARKSLAVVQP